MPRYSKEFIGEIKTRLRVSDVVGKFVKLTQRGNEFVGLSPFKNEKTPSFTVNDEKEFFHCFSSAEHGDIFSFLMKHKNMSYPESIEYLANQAGLDPETGIIRDPNYVEKDFSSLKKIINEANNYFKDQLKASSEAQKYIDKRSIDANIIQKFELGYSGNGNNNLYNHLKKIGLNIDDAISIGLIKKSNKKKDEFYDFFRNRFMFPIKDYKSNIIAFGGRALDNSNIKYINSSDSPIFKKSFQLYNLNLAIEENRKPKDLIIVEGYMDVIGLYEHGIKNAVASSGTAFTQEQLRKILNYTNKVYIVFDGDEAGMKASWRTVENSMMLLREDTRINFIFLDEGDDPDSYIKSNGKNAFLNLAKNSTSLSDYFFDTVKSHDDLSSIEGRTAAAKYALPLIKSIANETIKQAYIKEMSKICDLDFSKLIDTNQNKPNVSFNKEKKDAVKSNSNSILIKSVIGIFTSLIQYPKLADLKMFDTIKKDSRFFFIVEVKNLYIENRSAAASIIIEKITDEKIKNLFGEASVSSIQLSEEDAKLMIKDCLNIILRTGLDNQEREEALKEKHSLEALSPDEKRELQQILLKKDKMSREEASLLKNLSSK